MSKVKAHASFDLFRADQPPGRPAADYRIFASIARLTSWMGVGSHAVCSVPRLPHKEHEAPLPSERAPFRRNRFRENEAR